MKWKAHLTVAGPHSIHFEYLLDERYARKFDDRQYEEKPNSISRFAQKLKIVIKWDASPSTLQIEAFIDTTARTYTICPTLVWEFRTYLYTICPDTLVWKFVRICYFWNSEMDEKEREKTKNKLIAESDWSIKKSIGPDEIKCLQMALREMAQILTD